MRPGMVMPFDLIAINAIDCSYEKSLPMAV
jgi:hypothetical protein